MDVASLQILIKTQGVEAAQRELDKLTKSANNTEKQTNSLSSSFKGLSIIASGMALGKVATEYIQVADAMKLLEARIKLVSSASENYASVQKNLNVIANQNGVKIKEIGDLYTKLSMSLKPLGVTTNSVMQVTDAFSKTLLISGASIAEASSATLQFSQAMSSGRLQGDEFRSMAENSPRFMKAMTDSLGKTSGEIRQMAEDGKLTSSIVGGALIDAMAKLREEARSMPMTVGKAFNELKNEATLTVEQFDKLSGTNEAIAKGFQSITEKVIKLREELPKMSAEMEAWEKKNEKGLYILKTFGVAAIDITQEALVGTGKLLKTSAEGWANLGEWMIYGIGEGAEALGLVDDRTLKYVASQNKLQVELAKTAKAEKDKAQAIKDAEKDAVAKEEFKKIALPASEVKKQLDQALTEYASYYKAIGDEETYLQIKKYQLREKDKSLNTSQIDEMINAERDKDNKIKKLAEDWSKRNIEITTNMAIAQQDELAKPFILLEAEYKKDIEYFKDNKEAQLRLTEEFNAKFQRLAKDETKKLDEKAQKDKQKDIQKELKLQEENFRIQARQVELLDDEADKQVALATLEYQRTQASLKAQVLLGEKSPEYYDAMMEMEDKLLEKQKQNWTLAGQVVNNVTSQMESSMTDFLDATSENFADFGKMATSILQEVYREIIRISVVKPLVSSLTGSAMSLFGGAVADTTYTDGWASGALKNAKGGAYSSPSLSQYSNQIVDKPTFFAFASGGAPNMGVMGEAGSEAILPLSRTSNGDLGVKAEGMGLNQVKIQIINESGTQMEVTKTSQTSDVEGMVIQAWISGISKNRYGSRELLGGR